MTSRRVDVLLTGGFAAGYAATQLREEGFDGSIALVGREPDPPYERPPCSKTYLGGSDPREKTLIHPREWYGENDVELLTGTSVLGLDTGARTAKLSTREEMQFDKALIATGAGVRRVDVDGAGFEGIHYLRTLGNADTIRSAAREGARVVLIGGSYIATEVAATLTASHGCSCAMVMMEDVTLSRGFGAQAGRYFQNVVEEHGIQVHGGDALERFEGSGDRVTKVVTKSGLELDADMVVVGIGAVPDVNLARSAGLEIGEQGGVRASSKLETSVPGIYAAGDICEYDSVVHRRPMRIEHYDVAYEQGKTAARNILGQDVDHEAVPYFFSDIADWTWLEYVGPALEWDKEVVRGSLDEGEFAVWYLDSGRLAGALAVNRSDDLEHARRFIRRRTDLSGREAELADVETDLSSVD